MTDMFALITYFSNICLGRCFAFDEIVGKDMEWLQW